MVGLQVHTTIRPVVLMNKVADRAYYHTGAAAKSLQGPVRKLFSGWQRHSPDKRH